MEIFLITAASLVSLVLFYNLVVDFYLAYYLRNIQRDPRTGIRTGAETIFLKGSSQTACLLIHGFIGSPTDFGNLPRLLNEKGYTVLAPLLPGHGRDPRDFSKVTPQELQQFVEERTLQLKKHHAKVVLMGFSMGGALSTLTAVKYPVDLLVLLAPCFEIKHEWFYLLRASIWNRLLKPFIPFVYRPNAFKQVFCKDHVNSILDYPVVSTQGAYTLECLQQAAFSEAYKIQSPVRILHSKKDRATEWNASLKVFETLQSTGKDVEFRALENSNHLIFWDYEAREVEAQILTWLSGF